MASFIRQEKADITRYLPSFLYKDAKYKAKCDAESQGHEEVRLLLEDLLKQFFVETATWGLDAWEEFLGIIKSSNSIKERRKAILNKINSNVVVTNDYLMELINKFIADDTGTFRENNDSTLDILLPDGKVTDFDGLVNALETYVPAHLAIRFVAYLKVDGSFYIGGIVQVNEHLRVDADTGYKTPELDPSDIYVAGLVSTYEKVAIKANINK